MVGVQLGGRDWVGLGFSDRGDIGGADLCVAWQDWRGGVHIADVTTATDGKIVVDQQQNCERPGWRATPGRTEFTWSRAVRTSDPADYVVEEGTVHLVWAVGRGPLANISGVSLAGAGVRVGMARVRLLAVPTPALPPRTKQWTVRANVSLAGQPTLYWCSTHRLPPALAEAKHHVVRYEPDISPGSKQVLHHMEVRWPTLSLKTI